LTVAATETRPSSTKRQYSARAPIGFRAEVREKLVHREKRRGELRGFAGAVAAPRPVLWPLANLRAHRVQDDVAHRLEHVRVRLDEIRREPAAEEVVRAPLAQVDDAGEAAIQLVEASGEDSKRRSEQ
jgi:hypothetical protein